MRLDERQRPVSRPRVGLLFDYDWDAAGFARLGGHLRFSRAGFDLFSFPSNARLARFDMQREVARLAEGCAAEEIETARQESIWRQADQKFHADAAALPDLDLAERELYAISEQENRQRMQVGGAVGWGWFCCASD